MRLLFALCVGIAFVTTPAAQARDEPQTHEKRLVGYFAQWSGTNAAKLRGELLTHVIYAFARIRDGECAWHDPAAIEKSGHIAQLQELKRKHPHIRTLISIGGWGGSAPFSETASSAVSREKFARSCAVFVSKFGFDGVDIDWEFPGGGGKEPDAGKPEDTQNFTLLLRELRNQLDEQAKRDGKTYLLTIAAPAGPDNYLRIELDRIYPLLDWINLMTYDFTGAWSPVTAFNAPLFTPEPDGRGQRLSADATVRAYRQAGVPADKIVLGVPFYAKAFGGVKDVDNGLFQPHDRQSPRPAFGEQWTYRTLAEHYIDKPARRFWHDRAKVPWLFDAKSGLMITYDDPESLRLKARYARENALGGVMIWELSQDDARSSLLEALNEGLRH